MNDLLTRAMHTLWSLACLISFGISATPTADADELSALDRARVSIGTFANTLNLEGRADGRVSFDENTLIEGSTRDFADDFSIGDRRSIGLWELGWRPFERHEFGLRHYRDERRRTARLDDDLRFDGEVFPFSVELKGRAAFSALELIYTGWFHAEQQSALGVQVGVLRLAGSLSISGEIRSDEFGTEQGEASVSNRVFAPLIGLSGRYVFNRHLRGFAEVRAVKLNYEGIDGKAFSATAGIELYPFRHLGVVLQYSDTSIQAERRTDSLCGELEVGFSGPQALLRWRM